MGEFVLALDVGTTTVRTVMASAAAHEEMQVAPLAVQGEGVEIPLLAFITEEGDPIFGTGAAQRGRDRPERVVQGFTCGVGDAVPIVVGGFSVGADELLARMVLWIIDAVVSQRGARPDAIALVHPTSWCGHRADAVRARLRELDLDVTLAPAAAVVAQQYTAVGARTRTICVYDLGGTSFEATLFRGDRMLGSPQVSATGGIDIDSALLQHVLGMLPQTSAIDGTSTELVAARRAVIDAKQRLSYSSDVSVPVSLGGQGASVRVTRSELEGMAAGPVARTVETVERALESERLSVADLDEVILIGGCARIPLVAETLSARLDVPLTVPDDPGLAAAMAAARRSWESLQAAQAVAAPLATEPAVVRQRARRRPIRVRIPYGAAATLAAGAVIVAAGMVFAATTPLGRGADSADGATPDELVGSGRLSVQRPASGYSVAGASDAAEDSSARDEDDTLADPDGAVDPDGDDRTPTAATPRSGGLTAEPPGADPRAGSAPSSSTGAIAGPGTGAPAPVNGAATPAQQEETLPASDPIPDPTPEPDPIPEPDPVPQPVAEPDPGPEPQPDSDPAPGTAPEPGAGPAPEPESAATAQTTADAPAPQSPVQSSQTASDPAAQTAAF